MGLAIGALVGGFLLDRVPGVRGELFATVAAAHLLLAAPVWALPETSPRHSEVWRSLRPRVGVPAGARSVFWRSVPALVATWATGGLYLSLGTTLLAVGSALTAGAAHAGLPTTVVLYGATVAALAATAALLQVRD